MDPIHSTATLPFLLRSRMVATDKNKNARHHVRSAQKALVHPKKMVGTGIIIHYQSGELTVCELENGPVEIVDFPMKNGGSFHSFLYVHQMVSIRKL